MAREAETTEEERRAFAAALGEILTSRYSSQSAAAQDIDVHQTTISNWLTAKHEPRRVEVFALEEHLELRPGTLSILLGYLPPTFDPPGSVMEAIDNDPGLTPEQREALLDQYQGALARTRARRLMRPPRSER
jgi:hypothetical protein